MKIINKTPHPVNILGDNLEVIKIFPKSDDLIRLSSKVEKIDNGEVPLSKTVFGDPEGLPEYKEGIYYIVSQLVKSALKDRADLLVPAEVIRDRNGNIVGCKSLGI